MKKYKSIYLLILAILIFTVICVPRTVFASTNEYPTVPDDSALGSVVEVGTESNGIKDSMLAHKLLAVYNTYYGLSAENRQTIVRQNMFAGMDFSVFDGVLDLSNWSISSLEGLHLINFSNTTNLTHINLSKNSLTTLYAQSFSGLTFIESLDISKNSITILDISLLTNLRVLDASDNALTEANLTFIKTEDSEAYVNLVGNKITSASDVAFNREGMLNHNINLYLINMVDSTTYSGNSKVKLYSGLTGIQLDERYVKGESLVYNKITDFTGLNNDLSDIVVNIVDYEDPSIVKKTITNSSIENSENILTDLEYGKYLVYFTDLDGKSIQDKCSAFKDKYSGYKVEIIPTAPVVNASVGGDAIEFSSGEVLKKDTTFTFSTNEENACIYYKLGSGDWTQGNSVTIPANNMNSLSVKLVVNGVESEYVVYTFKVNKTFGFQELLNIVLVALGGLALFFIIIPTVRFFIKKPISVKSKEKNNKSE